MLPEEERHFLPLHQNSPHQKLIERVGKAPRLWVVYVHDLLFASLFTLLTGGLQLGTEEGARTQSCDSLHKQKASCHSPWIEKWLTLGLYGCAVLMN